MSRLPKRRPDLEGLAPYRTSATSGGRTFLHANESPYGLPDDVMAELADAVSRLELNRYPAHERHDRVVAELASYVGVEPERIFVGDGSNEVLLQACLAYGGPGRRALLFEPTYRMHYRQARIAGTAVESCPRRADYSIDLDTALDAIDRLQPEVVVLCTPNNPTGTVTPIEDVIQIAQRGPGLVLIDEAYFEFSGTSFVPCLADHPNVLISRTLSKAFRLAGLRFGYAIADPAVLEPMRTVAMPYAQSSFTLATASIVLKHQERILEKVPDIVAERERIAERLAKLEGVRVFESGANFILFRHAQPTQLVAALGAEGVVIRDFTHLPGCEGCLRVTVGRPDENDAFLEVVAGLG